MYGFMTFHLAEDDDDVSNGVTNFVEATKRQRGLLGSIEILGKKFKSLDPDAKNEWFSCWFDDDAQTAFNDIMDGEPVVYLSQVLKPTAVLKPT